MGNRFNVSIVARIIMFQTAQQRIGAKTRSIATKVERIVIEEEIAAETADLAVGTKAGTTGGRIVGAKEAPIRIGKAACTQLVDQNVEATTKRNQCVVDQSVDQISHTTATEMTTVMVA
jgi:hypothetical protein